MSITPLRSVLVHRVPTAVPYPLQNPRSRTPQPLSGEASNLAESVTLELPIFPITPKIDPSLYTLNFINYTVELLQVRTIQASNG